MIRKSKNNENKPDFDVMFNEVQEEIQEKDAEQDIVSRVPEIKQLSTDIDKATTAVINAKLSLESSIRQTQREEGVLGAAVNTINPVRRLFLSEGSRRTGLMIMSGFRRQ